MYVKSERIIFALFVIVELCHCMASRSIEPKIAADTLAIVDTTNEATAERGQFTYQVSIRPVMVNYHQCSGALLSDRWVLTSATCAGLGYMMSMNAVTLAFGGFNVREGYSYLCNYFKMHEHFRMDTYQNDIALLRTERPVLLNQYVQPIPYFKGNNNGESGECGSATDPVVIGWGMNTGNDQYLFYAQMRILTNTGCRAIWKENYWPSLVPSTVVCASYNGSLSPDSRLCNHESGLPLSTMGSRVLFGIQAGQTYGDCDNSGQPNIFTRTADFAKWIFSITKIDGVDTL